jgi:hypothetical protein
MILQLFIYLDILSFLQQSTNLFFQLFGRSALLFTLLLFQEQRIVDRPRKERARRPDLELAAPGALSASLKPTTRWCRCGG